MKHNAIEDIGHFDNDNDYNGYGNHQISSEPVSNNK
jgi:hypothetical protein